MSDDELKPSPGADADAELEREIRKEMKFDLASAIGRLAGPGAMKGESPVTRKRQAEVEIERWLRENLTDVVGALRAALHRYVKGSDILLENFDQPLTVLAGCCRRVLDSDYRLKELTRDADVEWGRVMGERPHFEREGVPHHPDDPYTIESVRRALSGLLEKLDPGEGESREP